MREQKIMKHKPTQLAACALALCLMATTTPFAVCAAQPSAQELGQTNGLLSWLFPSAEEVPVTEIQLGEYQETMTVGTTQLLQPVVLPENTTETTMTVFSENTSIVQVNEQGYVGAVAVGSTRVGITCGDVTVYYPITVEADPSTVVTDMELSISSTELYVGETASLSISVLPTTATNTSDITVTSSNEKVATASLFGSVEAIAPGTARITVTCGNIARSVDVTVSTKTDGISVDKNYLVLKPGATHTIKASVTPADAPQALSYSSLDTKVATVSSSGVITAVASGSTTVVVSNGATKAAITVIVNLNATVETGDGEETTPEAAATPEAIATLVEQIQNAENGAEIRVAQSEMPVLSAQVLKALHGKAVTLTVVCDGYEIQLRGEDVVNAGNELDTRLTFAEDAENDGVTFTLNDGANLPGTVRVVLNDETAAAYTHLYLYNTTLEKWQTLNTYSGRTMALSTAGQYLLREKAFVTWGVNWWFVAAAAVGVAALLLTYIFTKRRYWFW